MVVVWLDVSAGTVKVRILLGRLVRTGARTVSCFSLSLQPSGITQDSTSSGGLNAGCRLGVCPDAVVVPVTGVSVSTALKGTAVAVVASRESAAMLTFILIGWLGLLTEVRTSKEGRGEARLQSLGHDGGGVRMCRERNRDRVKSFRGP